MHFFNRPWSDAEKWAMGLSSTAIVAIAGFVWHSLGGDVVAEVASTRDKYGRCVDAEVRIVNRSSEDATDLLVSFDVDHFTRSGAVSLEYGDEADQMIPPGQKTLLHRATYIPISAAFDPATSTLSVPRLQPSQQIHLFFGGEAIHDAERATARERLLMKADPDLIGRPRVSTITRKDGTVVVRRVNGCQPP